MLFKSTAALCLAFSSLVASNPILAARDTASYVLEFWSAAGCTGSNLGEFGDNEGDGSCMSGFGSTPQSVQATFTGTNGNGFGNLYATTDDLPCQSDGESPGNDQNTCRGLVGDGCWDLTAIDATVYYFDGQSETDCVVLPASGG